VRAGWWQLFDQYKGGAAPPKELGPSREYNLDLIPKFMMANGKLVQGACCHPRVRRGESCEAREGGLLFSSFELEPRCCRSSRCCCVSSRRKWSCLAAAGGA